MNDFDMNDIDWKCFSTGVQIDCQAFSTEANDALTWFFSNPISLWIFRREEGWTRDLDVEVVLG